MRMGCGSQPSRLTLTMEVSRHPVGLAAFKRLVAASRDVGFDSRPPPRNRASGGQRLSFG